MCARNFSAITISSSVIFPKDGVPKADSTFLTDDTSSFIPLFSKEAD